MIRAVLDTNVVFEGLSRKGGACGFIVDAWYAGLLTACVSNALVYEYQDVFSKKFSERRRDQLTPLLAELISDHAEFITVWFSWRPVSPDPADDHVIDCAMNARAPVVTSNVRDFRIAERELGLNVITPVTFLELLVNRRCI